MRAGIKRPSNRSLYELEAWLSIYYHKVNTSPSAPPQLLLFTEKILKRKNLHKCVHIFYLAAVSLSKSGDKK